jgi:hypothetical protein
LKIVSLAPVAPSPTLEEIFGPHHAFCPRASYSSYGWLPEDQAVLDSLTGGQLAVMGSMPVLCSRAVASGESLTLLREAGLAPASCRHVYSGEDDYRRKLRELSSDHKLVLQHVHPPEEVDPEAYWIPRELLAFLNNKANLADLVPSGQVPRRTIVAPERLKEVVGAFGLPSVTKAASDLSSGSGLDVVLCRIPADVLHAEERFACCERVVVEEFLCMERNLCVQFFASVDGSIRYLGSTEQVVDGQGNYLGNWVDAASGVPAEVVELGETIMAKAAAMGYRGVAGFDTAVLPGGGLAVFDLNFRLNGSTAALMLFSGVSQREAQTARFRPFRSHLALGPTLRVLRRAIRDGELVPLSFYNPFAGPVPGRPPSLSGMLFGSSRNEVRKKEARLAAEGIGW